ncbi:MAG: class I poly(R)-hydroxyalkanoic acid synthase [Rhodobacteraceae bacterium]|nr:class I poly(R)-hydroxyalkanoic acid synthase [Paracoccaceae bacterium]
MDEQGQRFQANIKKLEELNARFLAVLGKKKPTHPALTGPGQEFYAQSAASMLQDAAANPTRVFEQQVSFWSESLRNLARFQESPQQDGERGDPGDRRFSSALWEKNPYFRLLRDQFLTNAEAVRRAVSELDGVDEKERRRLEFFSSQIVEMMSPSNFLATNPEALERAAETEGDSLVRGLENLVRDLERNDGELLVTLADPDAFSVGDNIAVSEGAVVYRNELFELIQYSPTTEKSHRIPLLIVPPWINKYYILDLKPENSFLRWTVEQGFTVFVVSWINPGAGHRDTGIDKYASDGCLAAVREVKRLTGEDRINAVGYCIGGTLLALTLAYMTRTGDKSVRSATFLTTLTDFSEMAELSVFIDDDFLDAIDTEVEEKGFLPALHMSRTFSFMRAADLVYGPAVRSYMMGEPPPAFDLLYWNGDSTNLPARMAKDYLRRLCQADEFAKGEFTLLGKRISLRDVRHPLMAIACESDHIANWPGSYQGIAGMGSRDKTFVLSQSGHIAGIVNPPSRNRYGHYLCADWSGTPDEWRRQADFREGSWWPRWRQWLAKRSGAKIKARAPGDGGAAILGPAPGTYVLEKA